MNSSTASNLVSDLVLNDYSCVYDPVTFERMTDPYITKYGHTFEKETILKCIKDYGKCPLTNQRLIASDIIPNKAIAEIIKNISEQGIIIPDKMEKTVIKSFQTSNLKTGSNPIEVELSLCEQDTNYLANINLKSIVQTDVPMSICCVIDISGSMSTQVTAKNVDGTNKEDGFSIH